MRRHLVPRRQPSSTRRVSRSSSFERAQDANLPWYNFTTKLTKTKSDNAQGPCRHRAHERIRGGIGATEDALQNQHKECESSAWCVKGRRGEKRMEGRRAGRGERKEIGRISPSCQTNAVVGVNQNCLIASHAPFAHLGDTQHHSTLPLSLRSSNTLAKSLHLHVWFVCGKRNQGRR